MKKPVMKNPSSHIIVKPLNDGFIFTFSALEVKAAVGKNGITPPAAKREGDGKTPSGTYPLREVLYRPDRISLSPDVALPCRAITKQMGWCDDACHEDYNRLISLPFAARHERLWRDDHAYDVVIPLGYNDGYNDGHNGEPPVAGRGSAIFLHILHEGRDYTEGCVAIPAEAMRGLVPKLTRATEIVILDA